MSSRGQTSKSARRPLECWSNKPSEVLFQWHSRLKSCRSWLEDEMSGWASTRLKQNNCVAVCQDLLWQARVDQTFMPCWCRSEEPISTFSRLCTMSLSPEVGLSMPSCMLPFWGVLDSPWTLWSHLVQLQIKYIICFNLIFANWQCFSLSVDSMYYLCRYNILKEILDLL